MANIIEKRISTLEKMMKDLIYVHTQNQIEFKEFKDEMKEFKDEMKEFKKEINKKWGDLSNSMGMLVENIVLPNLRSIGEKYFGLKRCLTFNSRVEKYSPNNEIKEFDGIVEYDKAVILNETKSKVKIDYINEYIDFIESGLFFEYFPEYKKKKLIPIFSSLYISENYIKKLTKHKIYCMAMSEDSMELLNFNDIKK